jgi:hypothetical protein
MPSKTENFKKYINDIFIETGSYRGDGISQAISAGFNRIISIELSEKYYEYCRNLFKENSNVEIINGDSYKVLPDIIKNINQPITFWLDGHHSCDDTALGDFWAPLIQELEVIKNHHIKTHTIIIDDMRCWSEPNPVHGFYTPDIIKILNEINSDYKLTYEHGFQENDILVAHI